MEVTEDTGAKIHNKTLREASQSCTVLINLLYRYQIIDSGTSLRIESSSFQFAAVFSIMLTENAQSHLEDAVPSSRPAIAELAPLSSLRAEYENGSGSFVKQIDFLKAQGYEGIRRSRGDGDCFYRCLSLSPPESLSLRGSRALINS